MNFLKPFRAGKKSKIVSLIAGAIVSAVILLWLFGKTGGLFVIRENKESPAPQNTFYGEPEKTKEALPEKSPAYEKPPEKEDPPKAEEDLPEKDVLLDAPFTSQAPFRNWKDPKQQDGCEEASALMAVAWTRGIDLTPEYALEEILAISDYEEKTYGNYQDTDAEDTAQRIFREYFKYDNIEVRHSISAGDIKKELFRGNLIIVPVNGRKLGNPYYTPLGPLEHNLVIRGYDAAKKEFITNDPGIMRGKNYRYKESVLEKALQDYPTGHHEPIIAGKTAMIVVKK